MRHMLTVGALVGVLALTAGCGDGDDTPGADPTSSGSTSSGSTPSASTSQATDSPTGSASPDDPTSSEAPEGTVVRMTLKDGQVSPNGERIEVEAGEPVTFEIDADAAGELHAHSNPEQSIEFEPGTSSHEIVIDQPGIVEVELHDPALVVVQLEVR